MLSIFKAFGLNGLGSGTNGEPSPYRMSPGILAPSLPVKFLRPLRSSTSGPNGPSAGILPALASALAISPIIAIIAGSISPERMFDSILLT